MDEENAPKHGLPECRHTEDSVPWRQRGQAWEDWVRLRIYAAPDSPACGARRSSVSRGRRGAS